MYEQEAEDIVQEALQNALDNGYDFSNMDLWAIMI
jgi:DNA-directed RNA polymerase specialized sigma24 family protein